MINLDLDGVLCNFGDGVVKLAIEQNIPYSNTNDWVEVTKIAMKTPGFFAGLEPLPGLKYFKHLYQQGNCRFLTSGGADFVGKQYKDKIIADKVEWLSNFMGLVSIDDVIVVDNPDEKIKYCTAEFDILIDDRYLTVKEWNKAGGIGILYPSREYKDYTNLDQLAKTTCHLAGMFV